MNGDTFSAGQVGTARFPLTGIDLADPDLYTAHDGGLDQLRQLQREHPVYWNHRPGGVGFWVFTRYADAVTVFRSKNAFTSRQGIQVGQAGGREQPAAGTMLVQADRGDHRRIKATLSPHLSETAMQQLLPALRAAARTAVDKHADGTEFDFMTEIAAELTWSVLGAILGIPAADRRTVARWTETAFEATTGQRQDHPTAEGGGIASPAVTANAQLFSYFADLLRDRRAEPGEDLISALARPRSGNDTGLTPTEILVNAHLLLAGGHETTRQALAGAVVALADHPGQWARLRKDPSLMPAAVEEIIRWSAPSLNIARTATTDIEIAGQRVSAGQQVSLWPPIANRDHAAFPDAESFDVGREPNRHLSFGMGSHFCLGAWTARREIQILLEELATRATVPEISGSAQRMRSNRTWGYQTLPVRLTTAHP
ncbi:cytochrome P450 [Asanoa siamensis]|uniref:Cytochrome P450 126 n=1 Tax=Asanoa siamensis TaxID=926357 RepID=A0ABQ4CWH7_9ACTN|nr:cytochrome P450 [Asanoa siamensis]GIF75630.1 putative cytochrome P450 126 [Asanoa siamensis]